jgi:hypothetical protein
MGASELNEKQILEKAKISSNTSILFAILIFIDSISRTFYVWSTPMVEGLLLIAIPTLFYITEIAKNKMMSLRISQNKLIIPCFMVVGGINLYASIKVIMSNSIIKNGRMVESSIPLILFVFFGYYSIVLLYAKHKVSKVVKTSDEAGSIE